MTATYTNQPGVRDVDTVRLLIYDRDTIPATDALLSDEEIQYFIDSNSHIYLAAADAAGAAGAKYAGSATAKKVGDLSLDFGDGRTGTYATLATQLRESVARKGVSPFAGGLTESGKTAVAADTDRVDPWIIRGMDDHEGTGETSDRGVLDL